jgi:hypothetical protein
MVFAAVLLGCGNPSGSENPELGQQAERDEAIDLRIGQSATVSGTRIAFLAVPEDSRCPRSVVCVWMGDGVVRLGIREGQEGEAVHELHTHPDFAGSVEAGGVVVRLVELSPYPDEPEVIPQDEYVARLAVTER